MLFVVGVLAPAGGAAAEKPCIGAEFIMTPLNCGYHRHT
jgi:hypothetical protein